MKTTLIATLSALLLAASAGVALASDQTAFELAKVGDKYIGDQSKDRIVEMHSDKSVGTVVPNVWYIVYYDPDAALKAVQVKFGGGVKMDVSRPFRLLEPITGDDRVLDRGRLKIDSDKALNIALAQPVLNHLNMTASQLWLMRGDLGPKWKVKLWAAKINHPGDADLGVVYISATDGSVIESDLHPDHAD